MRILFLTHSLSRAFAGIHEVGTSLGKALQKKDGITVDALGLWDNFFEADRETWGPCNVKAFKIKGPKGFGYTPELLEALHHGKWDVGHLHALWMYPSVAIHKWSVHDNKPYVITPNGMLEPWALRNSALKKRIATTLYQRKSLEGAACLQANTLKERDDFRTFGLTNPICIVPNGVNLPSLNCDPTLRLKSLANQKKRRRFFYLGRIHQKKGLIEFLKGFSLWLNTAQSTDWQLVIAGKDDGDHLKDLYALCKELELNYVLDENIETESSAEADVVFSGVAYDDKKTQLLLEADYLVLPSHSEGQPMIVLEAWAHGVPVLMTHECNLPEGFSADAALPLSLDTQKMAQQIDYASSLSQEDCVSMGARGQKLVNEKFTWDKVADQMLEVYQWLAEKQERPDWVTLD